MHAVSGLAQLFFALKYHSFISRVLIFFQHLLKVALLLSSGVGHKLGHRFDTGRSNKNNSGEPCP
ncbi:hypothetical protein PCH70_21230 [Pseudomonas cichorii JBC1]|nr:hypothetical protein PCH70_21230 [Pseudomonas cichorii JBC1]